MPSARANVLESVQKKRANGVAPHARKTCDRGEKSAQQGALYTKDEETTQVGTHIHALGAATGSVTGRCCKSGRAAYTARQRGTCECADHALVANPVAEMQVDTLLQLAREKVQNCARAAPFCPTQGGPSNWPAFLHLDPFIKLFFLRGPQEKQNLLILASCCLTCTCVLVRKLSSARS